MAQTIHVVGKTTLKLSTSVAGQTDEQNDISAEIFLGEKKIHTNESGPHVPAKIINLGEYAMIRVPLISWDDAVIDVVKKRLAGTATAGQIGVLGSDLTLFQLDLTTTVTGEYSYSFPKVRLVDNWSLGKWGYEGQRLMLIFQAIPDPAALSTATTALYTKTVN